MRKSQQQMQKPEEHSKSDKLYNEQRERVSQIASRYAITFGQTSILHIGSSQLGTKAEEGFTIKQLKDIKQRMEQQYKIDAQLIMLSDKLPQHLRKDNQAAVLYLPGITNLMMADEHAVDKLCQEQQQIQYDTKYYDARKRKTFNKQARYNVVFGDQERVASEDYKQFTIKSFSNLKYLNRFRYQLQNNFGVKAKGLYAEGNRYYETKSGIGFHGDSERKIVICLNLGKSSKLRYFWRSPNSSQNKYGPTDLHVRNGDIYIMSQKASGHDWRLRSKYRLVHGAGSEKYIGK